MRSPFPDDEKGLLNSMNNEFVVRMGTFFLVIGVGIFILFIASEFGKQPNFDYLFWSVLSATVGIMLRSRRPPRPPSDRFSYVRKLRTKKHPEKEKK
jgi:fatty acid desaturase